MTGCAAMPCPGQPRFRRITFLNRQEFSTKMLSWQKKMDVLESGAGLEKYHQYVSIIYYIKPLLIVSKIDNLSQVM